MTLITPEISHIFKKSVSASSLDLKPLASIGMVGASVDLWKEPPERTPSDYILMPSEELFLISGNRLINPYGYRVDPNANIYVSELKKKSDFLQGAFNRVSIDFLVLSSIYYSPDRDHNLGVRTLQSPLAADPKNWVKAFKDISAVAILNIWQSMDQESGEDISEFIMATNMYESINCVSSGLVIYGLDTTDYILNDNGGELFLRREL